jgi:hypothetical protein
MQQDAITAPIAREACASARVVSKAGFSSHSLQANSLDFLANRPKATPAPCHDSEPDTQEVYSKGVEISGGVKALTNPLFPAQADQEFLSILSSNQDLQSYQKLQQHADLHALQGGVKVSSGGAGHGTWVSATTPLKRPAVHPFWSALRPQQRAIISEWGSPTIKILDS